MEKESLVWKFVHVRRLRKQSEATSQRLENRIQYLAREEQRAIRSLSQFHDKTNLIYSIKSHAAEHKAVLKRWKEEEMVRRQWQREINQSGERYTEDCIARVKRTIQCGRRNDARAMRVLKSTLQSKRSFEAKQALEASKMRVQAIKSHRNGVNFSPEGREVEKRSWGLGGRYTLSEVSEEAGQSRSISTDLM